MPIYPTVYTFLTKNDMVVRVRPLRAEDAPYLVDLFENMSQDSRYSRFLQTLENIEMERVWSSAEPVSYTHLRAHETVLDLVCRLLLEKKKINTIHPPYCLSNKCTTNNLVSLI